MKNEELKKWIEEEIELNKPTAFEERKTLKFEEEETKTIIFDVEKPFKKYKDAINGSMKAFIPCQVEGSEEKYTWWLNVKNPLYYKILLKLKNNETKVKIKRTGKLKNTRYHIIE